MVQHKKDILQIRPYQNPGFFIEYLVFSTLLFLVDCRLDVAKIP